MSRLERFLRYAQAFELAQAADDFSIIAPFFAPGAVHHVTADGPLAADDRGRDTVVAGLRASVHGLERRFDLRVPEILEGPVERDDGVWMRFGMRLVRAGLPELCFEGDHWTRYDAEGAIVRIDEEILDGGDRAVEAYLKEHDAALRPVGSPAVAPDAAGAERLRDAQQRSLVRCYGQAKSHRDVEATMAVCHSDFRIDTIPFRLATRDAADTRAQLGVFFSVFPDYRAETEAVVSGPEGAAWWGQMHATFGGPLLGREPTGRTTRQPASSVFLFRDGLLVEERFHFDLGTLCRAIGLPTAELDAALEPLRHAQAA